ncbi:hypothetical protein [Novosphingobium sp.]|uniref:hypothetical protein n=1 Tax=Novosphingobium sp. TaxID=1874826 RepID=UPI0026010BB0|nr:hypothetical protein [Novosphingobium sp.]
MKTTTPPPAPKPARSRPGALPAFTPVPRISPRHTGWTPERQLGFIEALADLGSVRAAANAVGMTPESAYMLRRHEQATGFRKAWEAALDRGVERLEDAAMERALNGVEVPVYSYGKLVGTRRVFNDRLLMFILRNRAAQRFNAGTGRALTPAQQKAAAEAEKRKLARLKQQWRQEWQAELEASLPTEQELYDQIDAKLHAMREREAAATVLLEDARQHCLDDSDLDPNDPARRYPAPDPAMLPPRPAWMSGPAPTQTEPRITPLDQLNGHQQWVRHVDRGLIGPAADAAASPDQED